MRKLLLVLILILLPVSIVLAAPVKFIFNGNDTGNDVFSSTGIFVHGHSSKEFIIVTNTLGRYSIALPYSEKWSFDLEKGHLKGTADFINFDVQIWFGDDTPENHLKTLKEYLTSSSNPNPATKAEFVESRGQTLLRTEVNSEAINPALREAKHINFYSVKKWGDTLYKVHLSVVVHPKVSTGVDERKIIFFLTEGFKVNVRPQ